MALKVTEHRLRKALGLIRNLSMYLCQQQYCGVDNWICSSCKARNFLDADWAYQHRKSYRRGRR